MLALEDRLGVRLPARTTRSVAPAKAGERLLRSLGPASEEVARGLSALEDWRGEPPGVVRLTTFSCAARAVLRPALPRFLRSHPRVSVEVNVDDRLADLVAAGFDTGIRFGETVERDMVGGGGLLPGEFPRDGREFRVRASGRLVVNNADLAIAAVRSGAGLGHMREDDVADDLAAGQLVQVLDAWCRPFPGCHLFYPNRQVAPAPRALIDMLRRTA